MAASASQQEAPAMPDSSSRPQPMRVAGASPAQQHEAQQQEEQQQEEQQQVELPPGIESSRQQQQCSSVGTGQTLAAQKGAELYATLPRLSPLLVIWPASLESAYWHSYHGILRTADLVYVSKSVVFLWTEPMRDVLRYCPRFGGVAAASLAVTVAVQTLLPRDMYTRHRSLLMLVVLGMVLYGNSCYMGGVSTAAEAAVEEDSACAAATHVSPASWRSVAAAVAGESGGITVLLHAMTLLLPFRERIVHVAAEAALFLALGLLPLARKLSQPSFLLRLGGAQGVFGRCPALTAALTAQLCLCLILPLFVSHLLERRSKQRFLCHRAAVAAATAVSGPTLAGTAEGVGPSRRGVSASQRSVDQQASLPTAAALPHEPPTMPGPPEALLTLLRCCRALLPLLLAWGFAWFTADFVVNFVLVEHGTEVLRRWRLCQGAVS